MEHTLQKWYLPLWCAVWEFLIAFSEAPCHRKIPLQSKEKGVGGLCVNTILCKSVCKHVHKPMSPHVHPSNCHQAKYQRSKPAAAPVVACICLASLFCVPLCGFCFSSYYWCLCLHQTDHHGPALGGVQGCRVGPQTGSHSLCGTDSSQKGHRGAERSREVPTMSTATFLCVLLVLSWEWQTGQQFTILFFLLSNEYW